MFVKTTTGLVRFEHIVAFVNTSVTVSGHDNKPSIEAVTVTGDRYTLRAHHDFEAFEKGLAKAWRIL
jgi:hypothetical protein